jgi:hypothetical protein
MQSTWVSFSFINRITITLYIVYNAKKIVPYSVSWCCQERVLAAGEGVYLAQTALQCYLMHKYMQ